MNASRVVRTNDFHSLKHWPLPSHYNTIGTTATAETIFYFSLFLTLLLQFNARKQWNCSVREHFSPIVSCKLLVYTFIRSFVTIVRFFTHSLLELLFYVVAVAAVDVVVGTSQHTHLLSCYVEYTELTLFIGHSFRPRKAKRSWNERTNYTEQNNARISNWNLNTLRSYIFNVFCVMPFSN